MVQVLTKAERRKLKSATRQYKKALKNGQIAKEKIEVQPPMVAKRDRKSIGKAMITLNQMVNGQLITGDLSVEKGGGIVENTIESNSFYRPRSIKVNPPYSQRAYDFGGP